MAFIKKTGSSAITAKTTTSETSILLEEQIKLPASSKFEDLIIQTPVDPVAVYATGDTFKAAGSGYDFDRITVQETPIAKPGYEIADETFGVLKHIDSPNTMFLEAKFGIDKLREELTLDNSADNLLTRIRDYIEGLYENGDVEPEILDRFFGEVTQTDDKKKRVLSPLTFRGLPEIGKDVAVDGETFKENDHTALFGTGSVLRDDIREIQKLRSALIRFRRWQQNQIKLKQVERERIRDEIPIKHRELAALNRKRIEARGDYQVVQQLVQEDWKKVAEQYAERAEILNNHKGLFYARVRETPFSRPLPRELPLRQASPDDVVPGCPMEDQDLPDELQTFMDTVLDIPIGSWAALRSHYRLLPNRKRLLDLNARRQGRIQYRLGKANNSATTPLAVRLGTLSKQNSALLRDAIGSTLIDTGSLVDVQRKSRGLLSLEDLLSGSGHRLRGRAETLHDRLNQAGVCLLRELREVRPSIRLQWAEAAELDQLQVEKAGSWPGIEEAREEDLNRVRTIGELIDWWFRQLHKKAPASSRSAIRNLVRACLLLAANDDPDELLQGQLKSPPVRLLDGDRLRVTLNREALPGTMLQLLDRSSRIVGTLRVDDVDEEGVLTTITKVIDKSAVPDTGFTCTGFSLPGIKRI